MKNLARELVGERKVQAKPARLVEVLGNGRGDEILEFVNVNVKRLYVAFLRPFAALLGRRPKVPVLNWSKGHLSFNGINPSACVPVYRVSDEGGFGRARPLGRAQPVSRVSGKTDRSRGWYEIANSDKTIAGKGWIQISTPPHVGKGVGIP